MGAAGELPQETMEEAVDTVEAAAMGYIDIGVFAVMLAVSALIGVYFAYCAKGGNDTEADYLVGGRSMGTTPIALSLFASFLSGVSLLGYPAEVYVHGGQIIYNVLCYPAMGLFLAYQLLPVFRELKSLSVYEYFALRFNKRVRFFASCLFALNIIQWLPVVSYVPALAFEQVTKIDLHIVGPLVSIVCIYYTTVGGIKAVVWTDAIQAVAMLGCILVVACKGAVEVGGLGVVWQRNVNSTRIEPPLFDVDPTVRHTIFSVLLGGFVRHTADAGLNQGIIQRFMALPSMAHCRRATFIFIASTVMFNLAACFCGLVAAAFYHDCDPITAGRARASDQIVPLFVFDILSNIPGMTGVFIAGVFSASMSSLSTGYNSLAAVILEDWLRSMGGWTFTAKQTSWILRAIVLVTGIVSLALIFVVEHLGMVLQLTISLSSIACGPLLTLFVTGMFMPWVNTKGAVAGASAATALVAVLVLGAQFNIATKRLQFVRKPVSVVGCSNSTLGAGAGALVAAAAAAHDNSGVLLPFRLSYLWYQPLALSLGMLVAGLAALAGWRNDLRDVDPRLVAPLARRFLPKKSRGPALSPAQMALLQDIQQSSKEWERRGSN